MKVSIYKLSLVAVWCLLANNGFAQACFNPTLNFVAGTAPYSICRADFNGDGKIDIATVNNRQFTKDSVSVLFGNGTGGFSAPFYFRVDSVAWRIVSSDFNGDGNPDLATANPGSNNVSILFGTGTGGFSPFISFTVGIQPIALCCADFDGDSNIDLAVVNENGGGQGDISILLGNGAGNFTGSGTFVTGVWSTSIVASDFNADAKMDLAVGNFGSNDISVLLGIGNGSFGSATNYSAGPTVGFNAGPNSICTGDFNEDGKTDLATSNDSMGNNVYVLIGQGTGTFSAPVNYAVNINPISIITADLNEDCHLDLVTGNWGSDDVSILLGNGSGVFSLAANFTVGNHPYQVISADFNSDTKEDIVTVNSVSEDVSVLLNCAGVECLNSINEIGSVRIKTYPNPCGKIISLSFNTIIGNSIITIQNALGQTVKQIPYSESINIEELPPGCYFIKVSSEGQTYYARFIKE